MILQYMNPFTSSKRNFLRALYVSLRSLFTTNFRSINKPPQIDFNGIPPLNHTPMHFFLSLLGQSLTAAQPKTRYNLFDLITQLLI